MIADTKEYIENGLLSGKTKYELRLSEEEAEEIKKEFPSAGFTRASDEMNDGKMWFDITIK